MMGSMFLFICLLYTVYIPSIAEHHHDEISVPKIKEIKTLTDRLLNNYSKHILPFEGPWPFVIDIHIYLVAVGEIDEKEQELSTVMGLEFEWTDESFKWNSSENNITYVTFGWQDVWKPVFRVANPHAAFFNRHTDRTQDSIIYDSNGWAFFDEMMITRTTCNLDMSFYPFDNQKCIIKLEIVGNSRFLFKLNISLINLISNTSAEHGSWRLIGTGKSSVDGCLEIVMKFARKPLFVLLHILLPIISLALLTPTVFLLPKRSGERLGFSVTMLLAISVYMTIVSNYLPEKSEPMSLILIMMCIWYSMDSIIVFIVIINTKIYKFTNKSPCPLIVRKFVYITRVIICQNPKHAIGNDPPPIKENNAENENNDAGEMTDQNENKDAAEREDLNEEAKEEQKAESNNNDRVDVTWQELSHCIDKWCFVISYVVKVTIPTAFLTYMKAKS